MGGLFEYQPPQFGFSRSEQRLLLLALNGGTDQELSVELGISLFTVKKTWRAIYERVSACRPELIPFNSAAENGTSERGREKKQRLIAYLREHLEELRPVSRKLLEKTDTRARSTQLP
jgi:DNA-binding CsgD family transcriptional regulator